jgi:acetyl-CoA carboxylase carboxyl transferase subunit beta
MPLFDKKYFKVSLEEQQPKEADGVLWLKCKACRELVFKKRVTENLNICPNCDEYFFLTAKERIAMLVDEGSFEDISRPIAAGDPLNFSDSKPYPQRLEEAFEKTGLHDAIIVGQAEMGEVPVVLAVMDFQFIGGSMGSVMGEQIAHGIKTAAENGHPFILISATGGARMQEGILSLMQMGKTSSARQLLAHAGAPFISVMTYPTTAGVEASIASLGDVIIAEKGALIGFTGRRVIEETIKEKLPPEFQTDQFAMERGIVDRVVKRSQMRAELTQLLRFFSATGKRSKAAARENGGLHLLKQGGRNE